MVLIKKTLKGSTDQANRAFKTRSPTYTSVQHALLNKKSLKQPIIRTQYSALCNLKKIWTVYILDKSRITLFKLKQNFVEASLQGHYHTDCILDPEGIIYRICALRNYPSKDENRKIHSKI